MHLRFRAITTCRVNAPPTSGFASRTHANQQARQGKSNARLTVAEIAHHCRPTSEAEALLAKAMTRLLLSARTYHRILKVARTIADLAGSANITATHVAEAIQFRRFDRAI